MEDNPENESDDLEEDKDEDIDNNEDKEGQDKTEDKDKIVDRSIENDFINRADEDKDEEGWIFDGNEYYYIFNIDFTELDKLAELRGMTYGLDGAFLSQMQPALLNIYEWASVEWHEYLGHWSCSDELIKAYQQQPVSVVWDYNVTGNAKESNREGNPGVVGHKGWHFLSRRPKIPSTGHRDDFCPFIGKYNMWSARATPELNSCQLSI
ncbi:hypothetical protein F5884DRAFT_862831 [Xylogone sp. PMI_703]|nr:hypothetical protein F5884DRAFT_862831 [Xylogone sp. PMI_703]